MADLAVGMAKSVVEGALTKAQAAIEEEAKLRHSAQRNLVFITGEFQMMQSFLNVADSERLKNAVVRTWVRQIRDLAYDVEDCIEFVVHLDKRNRWWLRLLQPGRCFMPWLAPLQLDEAVAELDRLKARVEDVSTRNARYSLISDSGSKPSAAEEPPASRDAVGATAFNKLIEAADTQKARQYDLAQLLTKKEGGGDLRLRVISVWGTGRGDLGTTSVVWNAYIDHETCKSFGLRAWVKLRHPFNPSEFVRSLMAQFYANTCQEQEEAIVPIDVVEKMKAEQGDLLAEFVRHVKEKRFLIVLEDLSTMEEWNTIMTFLPKRKNGSCIVVSTQQFEVASLSVGHPYHVLHLSHLSIEHPVYAFFKMASERNGDNPPASTCKKEAAKKWMEDHPLIGRESGIKDLDHMCAFKASFKFFQVMSVWGIAGIGKSALVRHSFCDKIRNSKLYKKFAWVDICHPFNLWDFSRSLLLSIDSEDVQAKGTANNCTMGSRSPILECREMLQSEGQRHLIVIDGLQSRKEWDMIQDKLVSGSNPKNVIIVITTEEIIATHCRGAKGPVKYNVKGLEPEAAFQLFKKVSKKKLSSSSPDVEMLIRELVSKCGGIPKVIVEIAESMDRNTVGWKERARSINNKFMQELETNREFVSLPSLFCWMNTYFRNCPDSLKPCIFYLSIFSQKQLIRRRRLVRRWIAEGYSRDNHEKSAEEIGEEQFSDLLNLSIIQKPSSLGLGGTRMVSCQVNGFFREYIVSRRMEENLVFELDGSCALTTQRTGRHLVISERWHRDKIVFKSIDFSKLRSLTVSGKWESFFISESMKLLRVLDLEDASDMEYSDLKKIVMWFSRLKFLSLRGRTEICHLPSTVGDLRQLESLDVRGTSIVTLPVSITKLEKLQYIRAGTTTPTEAPRHPVSRLSHFGRGRQLVGVEVPPGIGKLTAFHTLGVVNVSSSSSGRKTVLEDLKKLTQLRKLGVSGINESNSKKFCSAILVHVHLESLSVQFDKDSQGCLDGLSLPKSLRSLKLYGLGSDQLSKFITPQEKKKNKHAPPEENGECKLAKMNLEMAKLLEKDVLSLGKLPELCILSLRFHKSEHDKLQFCTMNYDLEEKSYAKLKILEIDYRSDLLLPVAFGKETMKHLEQLKVNCGNGSSYQFSGLQNLPELKEVLLKGSNVQILKEDLETELKNHPAKPVVTHLRLDGSRA